MGFLPETLAAVRCVRLARGLHAIWRFCRGDGRKILTAVDGTVMPLVEETVRDTRDRDWIRGAFQTAAIKFGLGMWGYNKMAGRPVNPELIALSTSFTRIYDDLIDHHPDQGIDQRFTELLAGLRPTAVDDLERLMHRLFIAIEEAVAPPRPGQFYSDVALVHHWQSRSRRQKRADGITPEELQEITRGKGGSGILVLYTLMYSDISEDERDLITAIGSVGQMIDDQYDIPVDTMDGISTPATTGISQISALGREANGLAGRLRRHFGSKAARIFIGLLYLYLAGLSIPRPTRPERYSQLATTPFGILIGKTHDITPHRPHLVFPASHPTEAPVQ